MDDLNEVRRVRDALEVWKARLETLITRGQGDSGRLHAAQLKEEAAQVKSDLRATAKYGTIDGSRTHRSEAERVYFGVAIRQASAELSMRRIISPSNPDWARGLRAIAGEFSYYLATLRTRYPEA